VQHCHRDQLRSAARARKRWPSGTCAAWFF